ncbi:MAG: FAD-dependent thymidylate synthase [Polyangiaceae bacterium]
MLGPEGDNHETAADPPRATVLSGVAEEAVPALFAGASRGHAGIAAALAELQSPAALAATPAFGLTGLGGTEADLTEHSTLHVALEGVSLLAARAVQDSRAVVSVVPADISIDQGVADLTGMPAPLRARVTEATLSLHRAYAAFMDRAAPRVAARDRCSPEAAAPRARALALGLVPSATRTRVYFSTNARVLSAHCGRLLAHPLPEVRSAAGAILDAARNVAPELFHAVTPSKMRTAAPSELADAIARLHTAPQEGASATMVISQPVRLIRHDKDALERVMLALAYDACDPTINAFALMGSLRTAREPALTEMLAKVLRERGPDELPPRGLEASALTFELMVDAATLHDLMRPRAHTASTQRFTCRLGFQMPEDLLDLGLAEPYQDAMLAAQAAWAEIEAEDPAAAEYAVPLGYRVRSLWTVDLRQLVHLIESRSAKANPMRVRRIAHGLYRSASNVLPWFRDVPRVDLD